MCIHNIGSIFIRYEGGWLITEIDVVKTGKYLGEDNDEIFEAFRFCPKCGEEIRHDLYVNGNEVGNLID